MSIKNRTHFGGVIFGLGKVVAIGGVTGDFSTLELKKVEGHIPECRYVVGGGHGRRRGGLEARAGEVDMLKDGVGGDGMVSNRAKGGPGEGAWVGRGEESMEVGGDGGGGEGEEGGCMGHEEGKGPELREKD